MTIQYNSNYHETMPFSDTSVPVRCEANTIESWVVPGSNTTQYQVYFSYRADTNVYVGLNAQPVLPLGAAVQPYVDYKPVKRYARGGDVLHFLTPDALCYFGFSLRQIQG